MTCRLRIEPCRPSANSDASRCLALFGELDYASSALLDEWLQPLLAEEPVHLLLDVHGLAFCDSAGLAVLVTAHQRLTRIGGSMTLRGVHGALERIVSITGLDAVLHIESPP